MQSHRPSAYAPLAPPRPRVAATSATGQALTIVGVVIGVGMHVAASAIGVAAIVLRDADLTAIAAPRAPIAAPITPIAPVVAPAATPPDLFVEHDGDDCAAAALRASHRCEDIHCITTASAELRACLARPEQEARLCEEMPDPSDTLAASQWIGARCSFEEDRDYGDCVRLVSVVSHHCAALRTHSKR